MDIGSVRDSMKQGGLALDPAKPRAAEVADTDGKLSTSADKAQVQAAADKQQAETPPSRAELEAAMNNMQEFVQSVRRDINFALDDGNGRVVVKVTDATSGDVIRQIPSEEALKLAENLTEVRSLLFKAEA